MKFLPPPLFFWVGITTLLVRLLNILSYLDWLQVFHLTDGIPTVGCKVAEIVVHLKQ